MWKSELLKKQKTELAYICNCNALPILTLKYTVTHSDVDLNYAVSLRCLFSMHELARNKVDLRNPILELNPFSYFGFSHDQYFFCPTGNMSPVNGFP